MLTPEKLLELLTLVDETYDWIIPDLRNKADEWAIGYSPELTKAIAVSELVKDALCLKGSADG